MPPDGNLSELIDCTGLHNRLAYEELETMPTMEENDRQLQNDKDSLPTKQSELPACVCCRKRKLRCSRERPSCEQCQRNGVQCKYDPKQKPGLKGGAVEALSKRVAILENLLLGQDRTPHVGSLTEGEESPNIPPESETHANTLFDEESIHGDREKRNNDSRHRRSGSGNISKVHGSSSRSIHGTKRTLDDFLEESNANFSSQNSLGEYLPERSVLIRLVDYFCISFHHWIPFLHKGRLQARVRQNSFSFPDHLLFHALTAVTISHTNGIPLNMDAKDIESQRKLSHTLVMHHSVQSLSIESIQSLVLIVFKYLNDGQGEKAWPLIGLLSRAVDYFQLTVESSSSRLEPLMKPLILSSPAKDWTELEERRRLFWVVFMFDRFCSAYTGWNTTLTSEEVRRRLPADGGIFTREEPTLTPYFGIWNKSAAKIGNSLVHLPNQYSPDDQPRGKDSEYIEDGSGRIEDSGLGAFAYCIEAIESMSQINTFFLQQKVDWSRQKDVTHWLTRFKELDLRLVHWKMFLPLKWKHADISRDASIVHVDPNLALAHITHNVSTILLHHNIAYPPQAWNSSVALPSTCSAEACLIAAIEVAHILRKFLTHTSIPFVNCHVTFCAFIAAQALLKAYQVHHGKLLPEFENLLSDMWTMSHQWTRNSNSSNLPPQLLDQAGKYARILESLRQSCQNDLNFEFDLINSASHTMEPSCLFSESSQHVTVNLPTNVNEANSLSMDVSGMCSHFAGDRSIPLSSDNTGRHQLFNISPGQGNQTSSITLYVNEDRERNDQNIITNQSREIYNASHINRNVLVAQSTPESGSSLHDISYQEEALMSLSNTLMNPQFLERDRVITSREANFWS